MSGPSVQGKVFASTFAVGFAAELFGEVLLYRTIPDDRANAKARFWARYVAGAALAAMVGVIGYMTTNALTKCGWGRLSWVIAIIPAMSVLASTFALQGVNTVLDETSGNGCIGLISSALKARRPT